MTATEIAVIISGISTSITVVTAAWRAISRFTRMEDKIDAVARDVRLLSRRVALLEARGRGSERQSRSHN